MNREKMIKKIKNTPWTNNSFILIDKSLIFIKSPKNNYELILSALRRCYNIFKSTKIFFNCQANEQLYTVCLNLLTTYKNK